MSFVFLKGLNGGWAFVYEISGCRIDSCCSYLNFRYRVWFEQGAPWYSDNYRVYIHSKTWMWHDKKNTQLKNFLPLYTVLLIYSKVKASQILHGETTPVALSKNWIKAISQKNISCLSYLIGSKKITRKIMLTWLIPNKYSTGYWRNTLSYKICHWVDIYRLL